jgi:FMN phosphatase YigB (HAD superfamily)
VEVVFVDVGGTLWPDAWQELASDRPERIIRLVHRVPSLSESQAVEVVDALSGFNHPPSPRQLTNRLVDEALRRLGLEDEAPRQAVINAMCLPAAGRVEPFFGAQDLLALLAGESRVIIVSNVMWRGRDMQEHDFVHFGLEKYVTAYVTSLDVGWRKPHRNFFDAALAAGGLPADRCGIIGNSETNDIEPAVDRGMMAVRVAIEEPRPASSLAHHVCTTLDQVTKGLFHPPTG